MRREGGFVLIVVLWTLALLTILTIAFARRSMYDNRIAAYTLDRSQAIQLARGAVQRGIVEIQQKETVDVLQAKEGRTSLDQRWAQPRDLFTSEPTFRLTGPVEREGDVCEYRIVDEDRYISINRANKEVIEEIESMSFRTVSEIMNRRTTLSGEREHAFTSLEELRVLEGMNESIWEGQGETPPLDEILTVWGGQRVNINTAPPDVLRLIPDVSESAVEAVIYYRAGPDGVAYTADDRFFKYLGEVPERAGITPEEASKLERYCAIDSAFFTITGYATQRQGRIRATVRATVRLIENEVRILEWREETVGI